MKKIPDLRILPRSERVRPQAQTLKNGQHSANCGAWPTRPQKLTNSQRSRIESQRLDQPQSADSNFLKQKPKREQAIEELLKIMATLRAPNGCPWDREQTHRSISEHAIEEVYEMIDAIEAGDDLELAEELGDLLLQVVFHCQMARERGAFDFEQVARHLVDKLIRRHPHVFGDAQARSVEAVWAQWEQIKKTEKKGTRHERPSALDGVPAHLPALMRAQKLVKKARKAGLSPSNQSTSKRTKLTENQLAQTLFTLAEYAQTKGWSAEELLRREIRKRDKLWRKQELTLNHKTETT